MRLQSKISGLISLILIAGCAASAPQTPPLSAPVLPGIAEPYAAFDMQRCLNMGNSFEAPADTPWGKPINPADFETIRAKGFDTVRVPVRWTDRMEKEPPYTITPAFMTEVETVIQAALDADLNVILNMHHNEEIVVDPKAAMPAYVAAWEQIAAHFKNAPDSLWFETLNEPHKALKGDLMRESQALGIAAIRETNPDRIIILGGEDWSGIRTLDTNMAPPDENIVYTFHYYDPFDFTHQKAAWLGDSMPKAERGWGNEEDRKALDLAGDIASAYRSKMNRPVFMGEFGANSPIKNSDRVKWAGAVRTEMEGHQVPWCMWAYSNTFAIYDNDAEKWDQKMLAALGLGTDN